jgi:hypothetical protein
LFFSVMLDSSDEDGQIGLLIGGTRRKSLVHPATDFAHGILGIDSATSGMNRPGFSGDSFS